MITIAQLVEDILIHDDVALAAAKKGWLNLSSYARSVRPIVQEQLLKDVQEGTIITALSRIVAGLEDSKRPAANVVQSLVIHSNLEGMTYERTEDLSAEIRDIYARTTTADTSYLTVTQGIHEVTVIAEAPTAHVFRDSLKNARKIYDKVNLVGITAKFKVGYLEVPNLIFSLTQRMAYKDINIIEIVSTATELTFVIDKKDLSSALSQLQKEV